MSLRIAMVSEHASPLAPPGDVDSGGQNVHVAMLATALAARGHRVTVYTRLDDPSLPRRVTIAPGAVVEHLPAGPPRPIPKDELLPHLPELAASLRRVLDPRADVLHAHFWMSGMVSLSVASTTDIPVLQTFHALGSVKRRHQGSDDSSPPGRVTAETRVARAAHGVIATCTDEREELIAMGVEPRRIEVVPSGVDTQAFRPGGSAQPRGARRRIITVGRLVPRKGVDDVLVALRDVPDTELVVLGGPAPEDLDTDAATRALRERARELGVEDRLVLAGRAARPDVASWLRSADLAVCAAWYEPFGIVPLEAMACGVPVVGTAVGGLRDTVADTRTGLLVPPRRPAALAAALRELLDDPERRANMARSGRRRMVERFDWKEVARRTEEAYQHLGALPRPVMETAAQRARASTAGPPPAAGAPRGAGTPPAAGPRRPVGAR